MNPTYRRVLEILVEVGPRGREWLSPRQLAAKVPCSRGHIYIALNWLENEQYIEIAHGCGKRSPSFQVKQSAYVYLGIEPIVTGQVADLA